MLIVLAALVAIPIAEIVVMVKVAEWIGTGQMIALLLSVSFVGLWIVKRQGTGALRRIRAELDAGRVPGAHMVDGGLLLVAGMLLLVPGFITDALGLLLLLPPVRGFLRGRLGRRFRTRVASYQVGGPFRASRPPSDHPSESPRTSGYLELEPPNSN